MSQEFSEFHSAKTVNLSEGTPSPHLHSTFSNEDSSEKKESDIGSKVGISAKSKLIKKSLRSFTTSDRKLRHPK